MSFAPVKSQPPPTQLSEPDYEGKQKEALYQLWFKTNQNFETISTTFAAVDASLEDNEAFAFFMGV